MSAAPLSANLAALASRSSALAAAVREASPAAGVRMERARTGEPVPVVRSQDRDWFLHSRYDPRAEAARLASARPGCGFAVVLGLGGGYHIEALLASPTVAAVLVIESDVAHLRALLDGVPLARLLADRRVELLVAAAPKQIEARILDCYQAVLHGSLASVPLEPRVRTEPLYFAAAAAAAARAVEAASEDLAAQARFGRRWFSNIIGNLQALSAAAVWPRIGGRAAVAAAGPSLEASASRIANASPEVSVIACDTALPALERLGIRPALVLSIDCQAASTLHFYGGLPAGTRLALDAGSPPVLARLAAEPLFLASPHPLASLISGTLRPLPALDSSGGNVAHAAVALASLLGAEEIELFGADFAYPQGKPYARGTYFYPFFQSRATRLDPADSGLVSFVLSRTDAATEAGHGRYGSRRLQRYRDALLARFGPAEEIGPGALRLRGSAGPSPAPLPGEGDRGSGHGWHAWMESYLAGLRSLAPFEGPPHAAWAALEAEQRNLWTTLFPTAAAMGEGPPELRLERARQWCCRLIGRRL